MAFNKLAPYLLAVAAAVGAFLLGARSERVSLQSRMNYEAKITEMEERIASLDFRNGQKTRQEARLVELEIEASALRAALKDLRETKSDALVSATIAMRAKQAGEKAAPTEVVRPGDGTPIVRRVFGEPDAVRKDGLRETWSYGTAGKQITFYEGGVYEWQNMPVKFD